MTWKRLKTTALQEEDNSPYPAPCTLLSNLEVWDFWFYFQGQHKKSSFVYAALVNKTGSPALCGLAIAGGALKGVGEGAVTQMQLAQVSIRQHFKPPHLELDLETMWFPQEKAGWPMEVVRSPFPPLLFLIIRYVWGKVFIEYLLPPAQALTPGRRATWAPRAKGNLGKKTHTKNPIVLSAGQKDAIIH